MACGSSVAINEIMKLIQEDIDYIGLGVRRMLTQQDLAAKRWRFLDHSTTGLAFSALQSFAYDDAFCTRIGQRKARPLVRTWVHHNTVVLGIQDSRLPYIEDGQAFLEAEGYDVIVRNSGGLAVPLDSGILNISLIVTEQKGFSINA